MKSFWRRERVRVTGGATLRLVVLACTYDDTTAVDLASGALVRLRVSWPAGRAPDLAAFDLVEATLADDPERDDLAHPEATTVAGLPRQIGTLRGLGTRRLLSRLAVSPDGPLLGFPGPSLPYWAFKGSQPSAALVVPTRGPQLVRGYEDDSTWARFSVELDEVWIPVEDGRTKRRLDAVRFDQLSGRALTNALGFKPHYLLVELSRPRDGHCYKVVTAILPKG